MSSTAITHGRRFLSNSFCFDSEPNVEPPLDNEQLPRYFESAETDPSRKPHDLSRLISKLSKVPSCFRYFLDGSRQVFKLDDVEFDGNIYPIAAGQTVVGCCRREDREIDKEFLDRKLVIVLPSCAMKHQQAYAFNKLLNDTNGSPTLKRYALHVDEILLYNLDAALSFEEKAIAAVQNFMLEQERHAVIRLAQSGRLKKDAYLIKDGSLEYRADDYHECEGFNWVLGVSKTFNPSRCHVRLNRGKLYVDPLMVAQLKQFERTNAYRYPLRVSGKEIYFCVWYVRLHENMFARHAFDGVLKVEKLMRRSEIQSGIDSERIDLISAQLMRERNPVCYGSDHRWANHIYPMYVTEQFAKRSSKR